jgi:hypothetical protein
MHFSIVYTHFHEASSALNKHAGECATKSDRWKDKSCILFLPCLLEYFETSDDGPFDGLSGRVNLLLGHGVQYLGNYARFQRSRSGRVGTKVSMDTALLLMISIAQTSETMRNAMADRSIRFKSVCDKEVFF